MRVAFSDRPGELNPRQGQAGARPFIISHFARAKVRIRANFLMESPSASLAAGLGPSPSGARLPGPTARFRPLGVGRHQFRVAPLVRGGDGNGRRPTGSVHPKTPVLGASCT